MLRNVFLKSLRDQRRALLWWAIGLLALTVITMLFYPSIRDTTGFDEIYEQMPEALAKAFAGEFSDFTSPAGYLNTQLFFFMVPLLFVIFAASLGSGAIAGEEARGTLGLLLSNPVPRWQVVAQKFGAMTIATLTLAFFLWVGLAISAVIVDMDIGFLQMAAATASGALLGLAFGTLALALGCVSGNRGLSIGVTSALGVAAYFLNALAPLAEAIEPFQKLSPFYYYIGADPLANGLSLGHASVLAAMVLGLVTVALIAFERRDLRL